MLAVVCVPPPPRVLRKIFETNDLGSDLWCKVLILLGHVSQSVPNAWFRCELALPGENLCGVAPRFYCTRGVKGFRDLVGSLATTRRPGFASIYLLQFLCPRSGFGY